MLDGDARVLDHPDAVDRAVAAVRCPNAGEVVVSAADGWEFADLGGRHHLGGGSHGSLVAGDSLVPVLDRRPRRPGAERASSTSRPRCSRTSERRVPDYVVDRAA